VYKRQPIADLALKDTTIIKPADKIVLIVLFMTFYISHPLLYIEPNRLTFQKRNINVFFYFFQYVK